MFRKFLISLFVMTLALLGTAANANATGSSGAAGQASCREPVGAVEIFSRRVHPWLCDNGWHGQITNGATGDHIWLDSAAGTVTGHNTIAPGATSANSGTVGQFGGPWRACGRPWNLPNDIVCTERN
jgi:hypothetical protein